MQRHNDSNTVTTCSDEGSRMVMENWSFLRRCVRRAVARTGMWHLEDDMWVAAALALVDARARWDADRGVPFPAFAERRVNGAILDELRRHDHLPRRLRARAETFRRARDGMRQELQREPTTKEMCDRLHVEASALGALDAVAHAPTAVPEEGLASDESISPATLTEDSEVRGVLRRAMGELPARLRHLLDLRYRDGLTCREIALEMQVSEPRVSQLHANALKRVREIVRHYAPDLAAAA